MLRQSYNGDAPRPGPLPDLPVSPLGPALCRSYCPESFQLTSTGPHMPPSLRNAACHQCFHSPIDPCWPTDSCRLCYPLTRHSTSPCRLLTHTGIQAHLFIYLFANLNSVQQCWLLCCCVRYIQTEACTSHRHLVTCISFLKKCVNTVKT